MFLNSMVQQILEHVITAVPASGLQVLPMATDLAHNLVRDSGSSEREAKESGHSAIAFLSKMCSIIASEVPGAQKDVDKLPWKELSLIPVTEEIFRPSKYTHTLGAPMELSISSSHLNLIHNPLKFKNFNIVCWLYMFKLLPLTWSNVFFMPGSL